MNPTGGKPVMQSAQQKAIAAAQAAKQGAINETQQILRTATSQVTGTDRLPVMPRSPEGIGQSNPNIPNPQEFDNLEAYRQQVKAKEVQRMGELKGLIDQEIAQAKMKREQEQHAIAQAQAAEMQKDDQEKEEQKQGFMATISRAAKRVKGRLGQVGKGKMEKGRAASG